MRILADQDPQVLLPQIREVESVVHRVDVVGLERIEIDPLGTRIALGPEHYLALLASLLSLIWQVPFGCGWVSGIMIAAGHPAASAGV